MEVQRWSQIHHPNALPFWSYTVSASKSLTRHSINSHVVYSSPTICKICLTIKPQRGRYCPNLTWQKTPNTHNRIGFALRIDYSPAHHYPLQVPTIKAA